MIAGKRKKKYDTTSQKFPFRVRTHGGEKLPNNLVFQSAADVKMEIPVLLRSLKSSTLSSTSFQMA